MKNLTSIYSHLFISELEVWFTSNGMIRLDDWYLDLKSVKDYINRSLKK